MFFRKTDDAPLSMVSLNYKQSFWEDISNNNLEVIRVLEDGEVLEATCYEGL